MGTGKSIKKWARGSFWGYMAEKGGLLKGIGDAKALELMNDPDTPQFVRDRLRAEYYGRHVGRGIKSARHELDS